VQTAYIVGGNALAVDLEAVGVKAEAFPEAKLAHVGVEIKVEHTEIRAALLEPSGVGVSLAVVPSANVYPVTRQRLAHTARIDWNEHVFWYAALRPCHAWHCREAGGEYAADCHGPQSQNRRQQWPDLWSLHYFAPPNRLPASILSFPSGVLRSLST